MRNTNDNKVSLLSSFFDGLDTRRREYFKIWAGSYLSKKSPVHAKAFEQYLVSENSDKLDKLDKYLSRNNHKELFQAAWRQAKRRKFDKEQVTLNLSSADHDKLQRSARAHRMSMTQYLIMLIRNNEKNIL